MNPAKTIPLPAGQYWMGSNDFYPEERPRRLVQVGAFALDVHPVTVAQFATFVADTGHVSTAEQMGHSFAFKMTAGPVPLNNPSLWWWPVEGLTWRDGQPDSPVTHVSLADAKAYAAWAGGRLPTEMEWEYAAWAGEDRAVAYAWGAEFAPHGARMAHVWQGAFPWFYAGHSAQPSPCNVGEFPANPWGFLDMIGNVWEWTQSAFDTNTVSGCCSCSPDQDSKRLWAAKGGSYLCAAEYCLRYRPAARIGLVAQSTTAHVGFRCAYSVS